MSPSSSPAARRLRKTATDTLSALAPTGQNPRLEALQSEIQNLAAPFLAAPPAHQGTLGYVSQGLSGVLGVLDAPATLLDTGFAVATADVAAALPSMPAAVIGLALHFGFLHAHMHPPSLVPPAPPVPLPSIGTILLAGSINVLINGIPAARAGDVGFALTCCSLAPPAEIVLGSSNVFIGGARAARMLDMTRHDNPVPMGVFSKAMAGAGMVAGGLGAITLAMDAGASRDAAATAATEADAARAEAAEATDAATKAAAEAEAAMASGEAAAAAAAASGQALGAALAAAQVAADAAALALQLLIGKDPGIGPGVGLIMLGSPNVLIGGFPCPNLMESLKGLMKAAKGLRGKGKRNPEQDAEGSGGAGCPSCRR
jgi:uncharacterized Zn-binding protein involved in type VI secretion